MPRRSGSSASEGSAASEAPVEARPPDGSGSAACDGAHTDAAVDRALTEAAGVAILVTFTVVVTLLVGLNVLVVAEVDDGTVSANFSFEYIDDNNALIVTHERGDEIPAGDISIEDPQGDAQATWAELAGYNESRLIGPGEPVQVSGRNAYGQPVRSVDRVVVYHDDGVNRTELSRWSGQ